MTDKLRLNKNALREQTEQLRSLFEFLPTLQLRKQQLQLALGEVRREQAQQQAAGQRLREEARPWASMLGAMAPAAKPFAEVERVVTRPVNVAGVTVPQLEEVRFWPRHHSLLATPPVFDDAVEVLRRAARLRATLDVLEQRCRVLAQELAKTSQRINLYERVLVPQARRNIRRLRVYLGDQATAAVCRAKLAKAKVIARRAEPVEGAEHGHR